MFNRHILALKMNYNVFTKFRKLQKPKWDRVYKIIKNSKTYKSYISYLYSRLRDGNGCAARTMEPECLMPSK